MKRGRGGGSMSSQKQYREKQFTVLYADWLRRVSITRNFANEVGEH